MIDPEEFEIKKKILSAMLDGRERTITDISHKIQEKPELVKNVVRRLQRDGYLGSVAHRGDRSIRIYKIRQQGKF